MHPTIITNPTNRTEVAGSTTIYSCSATGYPPPIITWAGPGKGVSTTTYTNTSLPTALSQYTVTYVNLTNQGGYHCIATTNLVTALSTNSTAGTLSLQCKLLQQVYFYVRNKVSNSTV